MYIYVKKIPDLLSASKNISEDFSEDVFKITLPDLRFLSKSLVNPYRALAVYKGNAELEIVNFQNGRCVVQLFREVLGGYSICPGCPGWIYR